MLCGNVKTKGLKLQNVRLRMLDVGSHEGGFGVISKDGLMRELAVFGVARDDVTHRQPLRVVKTPFKACLKAAFGCFIFVFIW